MSGPQRAIGFQALLSAGGEPRVQSGSTFSRVSLDGSCWVDRARCWLNGADTLLERLLLAVEWRQGRRWMYERVVDDPRLSRWYGRDDDLPDTALDQIRYALEAHYRVRFGGVGLNYYRDGRDSVAFHRDRELRYLDDTLVAILTLGGPRPFLLRRRCGGTSRKLLPGSGDLIVMGGGCQMHWEHAVPKSARATPRISVSLRWSSGRVAATGGEGRGDRWGRKAGSLGDLRSRSYPGPPSRGAAATRPIARRP